MSVQKRKRSRSRVRKKRANKGLKERMIIACPQCGEPSLPHRICPHCGYYNKRKVVEVTEEE